MSLIRFRIVGKIKSGNGRVDEPLSFFKLRVGSHCANKQAYDQCKSSHLVFVFK